MKKKSSFTILFLFIAMLACNFFSPTTTEAPTSQPGPAAKITRELNIVRKGSSADNLVELYGTGPLLDGDVVQVAEGGEAILDFGDFLRMRLFNDSRLNAVKVASAAGVPLDVRMTLEAGGFTGVLTQSGGHAEYQTPGGTRILVLGTEFFVIYDPASGVTTVGSFQGLVGVEAGGVGRAIPAGFFVEVSLGGQPGPEIPIRFTLQELDRQARVLRSPIAALHDLVVGPTPTATSETPSPSPTASSTSTLTSMPTATSTWTPTPTATYTWTPTPTPLPDLFISEFSLDPSTPTQGIPVSVRVGVYNQGSGGAGAFTVQWWPGENYTTPACTWRVESLVARGGRILTCTYDGYPSWYGSITTKADADTEREVAESEEENNTERMTISVAHPSTFRVVFDSYPDGTPITTDQILQGDEFLAKGIRLVGAPESSYCADAIVAAIRRPNTYGGVTFYFLTSASPDEINRCNTIPVAIIFTSPVRQVTLTFAGASVTYTMKVYDSGGSLLGTVQKDAVWNAGTFEVTFSSESSNISRVTFGSQTAVTAIKEIYFER